MVDQLKIYPVWSNFIYFIAGCYAFVISIRSLLSTKNKNTRKGILFLLYAIIILLAGIFSIVYHVHTPSWTGDPEIIETNEFDIWLKLDQTFAILIVVYSFLFFLFQILLYYIKNKKLPKELLFDPNFSLSILFIILSFVFYGIAHKHFDQTSECTIKHCVNINLDSYDIFHSNWHIFTSVALIFWITVINNLYHY